MRLSRTVKARVTSRPDHASFYQEAQKFYHAGPVANQLNIKSEDGYRLATALSALTGESLTAAVTEALRERLDREQRARDRAVRLARLGTLAAEIRGTLRRPDASPGFLYDDGGLPR